MDKGWKSTARRCAVTYTRILLASLRAAIEHISKSAEKKKTDKKAKDKCSRKCLCLNIREPPVQNGVGASPHHSSPRLYVEPREYKCFPKKILKHQMDRCDSCQKDFFTRRLARGNPGKTARIQNTHRAISTMRTQGSIRKTRQLLSATASCIEFLSHTRQYSNW